MKKLYSIKKSLAVGAMLLAGSAVSISAKTVYIVQDGIRYYWNNTKSYVEVTSPEKGSTYVGDIEIPASITYDDKNLPVTAVRSSAFTECAYLTSVVLPESVTSIGDYAFDTCEELKSVVMPGVKTIVTGHSVIATNSKPGTLATNSPPSAITALIRTILLQKQHFLRQ